MADRANSPTLPGAHPDSADIPTDLEALEHERALLVEWYDTADHGDPDDDPVAATAFARWTGLEEMIASAPAYTPADLAVKLRSLRRSYREGHADWDEATFATMLEALERMAAAGGGEER